MIDTFFGNICAGFLSVLDFLVNFLVGLSGVFSWPIVALILILFFKRQIRKILNELQLGVRDDGKVGILPQRNAPDVSSLGGGVDGELATPISPVVNNEEGEVQAVDVIPLDNDFRNVIKKHLQAARDGITAHIERSPASLGRLDYVETIYTDAYFALMFERAYQFIYGSQISFLRFARDKNQPVSRAEAKSFYLEAKSKFPNVYQNVEFEVWLSFMYSHLFLQEDATGLSVTEEGRAFLSYIIQVRTYLLDKAG